ncbi:MAG: sulfite exporter TauE/SafE family protein [SAR202 cluster bacterium]|nr:sulfite exporter TauE/SafE family protein [SAR202 cluster bacterium]
MEVFQGIVPYLVLGIGTGIYGILVGAGGGVILAPSLMIFLGVDPTIAAGTSLTLVSVNSISGTLAYKRTGFIDLRSGLFFALAAVPGSILAPLALDYAPAGLFKILFGILLLGLAILIGLKPESRERESSEAFEDFKLSKPSAFNSMPDWLQFTMTKRRIVATKGRIFVFEFNESLGTAFNIVLGFISSFFGTGGGFLRTPALVSVFGFPVQVAVATSIFALSIYSTIGAGIHAYLGNVDWYPTFVWSGIGLIIGGQIGARLMEIIKGIWILRILLLIVLVMGIQLIIQGLWPQTFSFTLVH